MRAIMVDINLMSIGRASALPTFALYLARRVRREAAVEPFEIRGEGIRYMALRGDSDQDVRERAGHADFETSLVYIRRVTQVVLKVVLNDREWYSNEKTG